jgi:GT2 family glycosyltransferase
MLSKVVDRPDILMLSGTARMGSGPRRPVLYRFDENKKIVPLGSWPGDRLFTVDIVGGFGSLIHRSVFESIEPPWFTYIPPGYGDGDDVGFCKRVREAGIEIWIDPTAQFGHLIHDVLAGVPDKYSDTVQDYDSST